MREVAATLGTHYPNMFRAMPGTGANLSSGFKPTLKVLSLNDLAANIIDRVSFLRCIRPPRFPNMLDSSVTYVRMIQNNLPILYHLFGIVPG
jgi:hypothetical protein